MVLQLVLNVLLLLSELWSYLNPNAFVELDSGITTENVLLALVDVLAAPQLPPAPNVSSQPIAMETDHANVPMEPSSPPPPSDIATNAPTTPSLASV